MGEPAQPGEDQLTTIVVEGPPANANARAIRDYAKKFEEFKKAMGKIFEDHRDLNVHLRQITYVKKDQPHA